MVSMEAYCMSAYEVITRSAHGLLLKAPSLEDLVIDVGVRFHLLHVLVGVAKTSNACLFIRVCTPVYLEHTCVPGAPAGVFRVHAGCPLKSLRSPITCQNSVPPPPLPPFLTPPSLLPPGCAA